MDEWLSEIGSMTQSQGYDVFKNRAQEIVNELRDPFLTFVDVILFTENAFEVIREFSTTIVPVPVSALTSFPHFPISSL